jgi:hypothetical protein
MIRKIKNEKKNLSRVPSSSLLDYKHFLTSIKSIELKVLYHYRTIENNKIDVHKNHL